VGIYFADKNDVNQSQIRLVTLGIRRDDPDYFATRVLNEALAGGFSSRLFTSLRTRQGLAYSVGGGIGYSFDHPGVVEFDIGTKSETTVQAIEAMRKEIAEGVTRPFTEEEVRLAKANILNSFVFRFDSKEKVLGEKMAYEFYHYPLDTLERFRKEIEKTTTADVNRVAKKYLKPEQLAVVVVGNQAEFGAALTTLGDVKPLDISIRKSPGGPPIGE
jgi:zinc protease